MLHSRQMRETSTGTELTQKSAVWGEIVFSTVTSRRIKYIKHQLNNYSFRQIICIILRKYTLMKVPSMARYLHVLILQQTSINLRKL